MKTILRSVTTLGFLTLFAASASAQLSPGPDPVTGTTGAQTLSSGTGTVSATGNVNGTTTAGVTITGSSTLNNFGTIQASTGRGVDINTKNLTIVIDNEGTITTTDMTVGGGGSDAIRVNKDSAVSLTNSGTISVLQGSGGQAIDWAAIATKTSSILNTATGQILDTGEDAIKPGVGTTITNAGIIRSTPIVTDGDASGSDGIDTGSNTGVVVTNTGTISGRHGITGGDTVYTLTVHNDAGTIQAVNGSAINIDGVSATNVTTVTNALGATFKGGVLAAATDGDGDGIDVDGVLHLTNNGDVLGLGAKGVGSDGGDNNAEAVSIGGGDITNTATGRIIGSTLAADAPNGDTSRDGHGILADNSSGGNAVAATTVTNSGLIQGKTGYGIKIVGTFADTITNNAGGIIEGANHSTTDAVISMDGGNDTLTNAGSIIHDQGDAQTAISMGAGDDTVIISGGSAVVTGGIDDGTGGETNGDLLQFTLGSATNKFTYAGAITNFEKVQALSGKTVLTGTSTYAGTTEIGGTATAARLEQNGSHTGGGAYTVKSNGILAGTGSITLASAGTTIVVDSGGVLAPGAEATTGKLSVLVGSMQVNGGLTFRLDGTAPGVAGGYDQLSFAVGNTGTFTLGAASILTLDLEAGPAIGTQFTIVDIGNAGTTVTGTFAGLAEGTVFQADNALFQITYTGGADHNDIVLTTVPEPSTVGLILIAGGALILFRRMKSVRGKLS